MGTRSRRGIGDRRWWHATCGRSLGSEATLDQLSKAGRRDGSTLSNRALVLVVNRLTAPGSEHGLARWLETDFVCDRNSRRWVAQWRAEARRKASRTPRVQVESAKDAPDRTQDVQNLG